MARGKDLTVEYVDKVMYTLDLFYTAAALRSLPQRFLAEAAGALPLAYPYRCLTRYRTCQHSNSSLHGTTSGAGTPSKDTYSSALSKTNKEHNTNQPDKTVVIFVAGVGLKT